MAERPSGQGPEAPGATSVAGLQAEIQKELAAAAVEQPALEARRLLADALDLSREQVIAEPDRQLTAEQLSVAAAWLRRRAAGEPLSRIRGWQEFYGRRFLLSPATLEPRADTETLIDACLELVDAREGRGYPWRILDIGTGTGCIACTLLAELPQSSAVGTDISAQAIDTARSNAERLGIAERCEWQVADFLTGVEGDFDILISNPPYIKRNDIASLQLEVRHHDPYAALSGGDDGLEPYRRISEAIGDGVKPRLVLFETACDDDERVAEVFRATAAGGMYRMGRVWRDLTGCRRCVAFETL